MTVSADAGVLGKTASVIDKAEALVASAARAVGTFGVLAMLAAAAITLADVVLRGMFGKPVVGLNEMMSSVFAVSVAACIPAGLASEINLSVDILDKAYRPRVAALLQAVGHLAVLLFMGLLAYHFFYYAESRAGRVSVILGLPELPVMRGVAWMFIFAVVVQIIVTSRALVRLRVAPASDTGWVPPSPAVRVTAWSMVVIMAIVGICTIAAFFDLPLATRLTQQYPGTVLTLVCLVLWVFLLGLTPISAAMGLLGLGGTILVIGVQPSMVTLTTEVSSFLTRAEVSVLPLYLLMGSFASMAGMSEDIYRFAHALFAPLRGGLAYATIGGCAGFGAVTGSSLATAATFGRVALPEMRQRGYSDALATGSVAAGGTLGQLIPPSTALIVYALLTESSIGRLFIAAMVPGIIAVILYFATIAAYVRYVPSSAPPAMKWSREEICRSARGATGVFILFILVIGGLYTGIFTVNESAAIGALVAFLYAVVRGKLRGAAFWSVMAETTGTTAMIYTLIFGALILSFYAGVTNLPALAGDWIASLQVAPIWIIVGIVTGYTILGTAMDTFAIMLITTPVIAPLIVTLGYDLVWWGIVMLIVVETGQISPPFGMNLFILKSVAPDVPLMTVFRGVMPFVASDVIRLALLIAFPILALWLPSTIF